MNATRSSLVIALCLLATPVAWAGDTLAVPSAFPTIQAAIDAASPGDTVLVADGVYTGLGNRNLSFNGKAITLRSENGAASTIINAQGTPTVPHRGFVFKGGETRDAVLDGFTITGGATLPGAIADTFNGGGVRIQASSPTIKNCRFTGNTAGCWGAALYVGDFTETGSGPASPLIENCVFVNNAADDEGGGFFTWGNFGTSQTVIRNSVFMNNGAGTSGGGICTFGGTTLVLENVTVSGNSAPQASNVLLGDAVVTRSNLWSGEDFTVSLWGTNTITYSNIKGGAPGIGNLDVDPLFAADGFHLLAGSPLVGAGGPVTSVVGQTDIDGQPRTIGSRIDIGADEVGRGHFFSTPSGPQAKN